MFSKVPQKSTDTGTTWTNPQFLVLSNKLFLFSQNICLQMVLSFVTEMSTISTVRWCTGLLTEVCLLVMIILVAHLYSQDLSISVVKSTVPTGAATILQPWVSSKVVFTPCYQQDSQVCSSVVQISQAIWAILLMKSTSLITNSVCGIHSLEHIAISTILDVNPGFNQK